MRILWRGAQLATTVGAAPIDLGSVRASLVAAGDRLSGPVSNEGGRLELRGEATLQPREALRLAMTLTPRRDDDVELARTLAAIAVADGPVWRVDVRVPLR